MSPPFPSNVASCKSCTPSGWIIHTARRTRPKPGMGTRCSPGIVSTAWTSESKSARSGSAMKAAAKRMSAMRLVIVLVLLRIMPHPRDAEVTFQVGELLDVDRADQVDDGQLARLGAQDQEAGHLVAGAHVDVDLRVLAVAALDLHQTLPARAELRPYFVEDGAIVGAALVELVRLDVDAFELLDHVARHALVAVVAEELRGEAQHGAVERHVDRFRGFRRDGRRDVDLNPLRVQRGGRKDQKKTDDESAHDDFPFSACHVIPGF